MEAGGLGWMEAAADRGYTPGYCATMGGGGRRRGVGAVGGGAGAAPPSPCADAAQFGTCMVGPSKAACAQCLTEMPITGEKSQVV